MYRIYLPIFIFAVAVLNLESAEINEPLNITLLHANCTGVDFV